jgi:hypothetical protein
MLQSSFLEKHRSKALYLGAVVSGVSLAWFFYRQKTTNNKKYPKESVVKALKEFHKEFYPIYFKTANDINRMKQGAQARGMQVTPEMDDELKMIFHKQRTFFFDKKQ